MPEHDRAQLRELRVGGKKRRGRRRRQISDPHAFIDGRPRRWLLWCELFRFERRDARFQGAQPVTNRPSAKDEGARYGAEAKTLMIGRASVYRILRP
jgi:hypothetical protein